MNEFTIINKYFKPLSFKNSGALKLTDDIFFDNKTSVCVSVDTYIHGKHFFSNEPTKFLKKILRASISDLYCKGVNPTNYLLSISLNKNLAKSKWLKDFYNILKSEQKKFKINLVGGDTTSSSKLSITFVVIGYLKKKPVLRYGSKINDDIYVITQEGDRLDNLAFQYYGDPKLWWYIATANQISTVNVPHGTSLRIPSSTDFAKGK